MNICVHHHVHTNFIIYHYQGSLSFLVIKFKVISRFCKVQKGHFPGLISDNFGTKRQTSKCSKNILCFIHVCCPILCFIHVCCPILGFIHVCCPILFYPCLLSHSRFYPCLLSHSRFYPDFLTFFRQIPGYFWTWTDNFQISRFSRLC